MLLVIYTAAHSQWYAGGKTALTLSNYKTKTNWKEMLNPGTSIGLSAFNQMNNSTRITIGFEYVEKGYYHKVCNTISDKLETTFLEIPMMIDYRLPIHRLPNFQVHAKAGMYGALWLSGRYKSKGFTPVASSYDYKKNDAARLDFGPNAGAQFEYTLNNGILALEIKYEYGIRDLENSAHDNTSNINRCWMVGISYLRPLVH
jgi:hypothetical protein